MKAKDLMIGDWVYGLYPNGERYANPFRISVIDIYPLDRSPRIVTMEGYGFRQEQLAPVFLTPEILEKSGFEFGYTAREEDFCGAVGCGYPEEKGWCYDEGAGEVKIVFPNEADAGLVRLDDECDNRYIEFIYTEPIMVHELQHALRLCGIEKEIEL